MRGTTPAGPPLGSRPNPTAARSLDRGGLQNLPCRAHLKAAPRWTPPLPRRFRRPRPNGLLFSLLTVDYLCARPGPSDGSVLLVRATRKSIASRSAQQRLSPRRPNRDRLGHSMERLRSLPFHPAKTRLVGRNPDRAEAGRDPQATPPPSARRFPRAAGAPTFRQYPLARRECPSIAGSLRSATAGLPAAIAIGRAKPARHSRKRQ